MPQKRIFRTFFRSYGAIPVRQDARAWVLVPIGDDPGGSPGSVELYKGLVERRHDHEGEVFRRVLHHVLPGAGRPEVPRGEVGQGRVFLFRFIALWLNARGFDVIKKRAQLDGHLIGDHISRTCGAASPARACRTSWSGRASTPFGGERGLEP